MNQTTHPLRRIDGHVHLIGDGSAGDGCWLKLDSPRMRFQARCLLRACGLPHLSIKDPLDEAYRAYLLQSVKESSLDAVLLLAQDLPHDDSGHPLPKKAVFYVPNEVVLGLAKKHPAHFLPAVSIHPARPDAIDALEASAAAGARVLKLLPNCLNVDCNRTAFRPFWERMAALKMCFLAHTGGELSLPVINAAYASPEILRAPLECGVTTIAAHGAGRSALIDPDYTELLFEMMGTYPNLYTDNSALSSVNRAHTAKKLLSSQWLSRVVHGSDFPIPVSALGPRIQKLIDGSARARADGEGNVFERDVFLKTAMGFPAETFTRLDQLINSD